jgi:copper resistance protein C
MLAAAATAVSGTAAFAHAFLDHASPPVGRTASPAPSEVRLWFTENLEAAFSRIQVMDEKDQRVDRNDSHVDPKDPAELIVSLRPLSPGSYTVLWRVVSVDTHVTEGRYTFRVEGP